MLPFVPFLSLVLPRVSEETVSPTRARNMKDFENVSAATGLSSQTDPFVTTVQPAWEGAGFLETGLHGEGVGRRVVSLAPSLVNVLALRQACIPESTLGS